MHSVVVYDSKFGNTERIAQAIARGAAILGPVQVMDAVEAARSLVERPDLLLIGGPTQKRRATQALIRFIGAMPTSLGGIPTASFDTRYRGSTWIMGSAAAEVAKAVRKAGGELIAPPESFFIGRGGPLELQTLEAGEIERAEAWGRTVGTAALSEGSEQ